MEMRLFIKEVLSNKILSEKSRYAFNYVDIKYETSDISFQVYEPHSYVCNIHTFRQWRSEGGGRGGASAPGRRPEGGAKIMPKNFLKFIY